jgi:serine/threonine-protein kinase
MTKKFSGFILYALITVLVVSVYVDSPSSLERLGQFIQDTMFRLRGEKAVAEDIVIVSIDDVSLESVGDWPWNRDKTAALINAISAQGPNTIMLGLTFAPDEYQKAAGYTDSLANAIARAGNVISSYYFSRSELPRQGETLPVGLSRSAFRAIDNPRKFSRFPPTGASAIHSPAPSIADSAAYAGFINTMPDKDRSVRWQPLIVGYRGEFYPSASVLAAMQFLGVSNIGVHVGESIVIGNRSIPTDETGRLIINFSGPERSFRYYSAADIINKMTAPRELSGKLVIVGYTAFAATDVYSTPVGRSLPGVEILANVTENIVHGNILKSMSRQFNINLGILIGIGLFCAFVLPQISLINRIAVLLLFLIVLVNMSYVLFSSFDISTNSLYPALQIVIMLTMAPFVKSPSSISVEQRVDDDEELDYEALLSSSDTISIGGMADQTPGTGFPETVIARAQATGGSTISGAEAVGDDGTFALNSSGAGGVVATTMDHFGRYKILGNLGKGAMGMVYKGLDPAIDRPVALKTIRLDQIFEPGEAKELRERLNREAKAAGKLSHPNIVTIYDVGEEGNIQYIAMEFLLGNTLESLIQKGLNWDYKTLSRVMIQICEALDYAHENGIVHRDIKPANVMILEGNKVKVMDFGIARLDKSASMTQTGTALGTPNYISPEQLKGQPVDRRSDIFSLGVVFYELLTAQKPFKGDTISALIYSILHTEPPPPSEVNLDVPRIFDKIIAKALVKDPDLRFGRARDMADILRKLI